MTSILVPVLLALNLGLVQDAPPPTGAAEDPYAMGQRLLAEGRLPEARDAFEQAIRANPLSAWPHLGLARVYLQEDRPNRSLLAINMAVDRSRGEPPTQRTMLMFRANVNYLMARLEEAATDLEVVLAAEPSNTEAIFQMGFVRLHQERFDEAMDQGKKLIRAGKRRADGYYFIGQSLFKKGNLANAESTLRTCLELDPRHLRARYALAQVLFRLEKKEESDAQLAIYERLHEATQEIETALKQGPSGTCAHCWRILSLRYPEVGENEKALAYARKVVEARPDEPHARFVLAVSQSRVGKLEEAVETYRGCIDDHPDYLPAYSYLSWLLATAEKVRDTKEAIRLAEKAKELGLEEVSSLAEAYFQDGQRDKAEGILEKAIAAKPEKAEGYRAQLARYRGDDPGTVQEGPPDAEVEPPPDDPDDAGAEGDGGHGEKKE